MNSNGTVKIYNRHKEKKMLEVYNFHRRHSICHSVFEEQALTYSWGDDGVLAIQFLLLNSCVCVCVCVCVFDSVFLLTTSELFIMCPWWCVPVLVRAQFSRQGSWASTTAESKHCQIHLYVAADSCRKKPELPLSLGYELY